jgi:hypothetical protein
VIVAVSLCASAVVIVRLEETGKNLVLKKSDVALVTLGALVILYTFMCDHSVLEAGKTPPPFGWGLFTLGECMGLAGFGMFLSRNK